MLRFLFVSSGQRRVIRGVEVAIFARRVPGSRLAAGHPKGLPLTRAHGNQHSPKACRARLFLAGKPDRGRLAPFPLAGRAGGWVGNGSPVPSTGHGIDHSSISTRKGIESVL